MTGAPLITTIVAGLGLAFVFGSLANRLHISPIAGYLLAGIAVGPYTPAFVADRDLALQLADIGVILLMFGVGLHFSIRDLMALPRAVIPGVFVQVSLSASLGAMIALAFGGTAGAGMVFGLALSVASTVVVLRALQVRRLIDTERGRLAIGWLVVQDIVTVMALVLVPALAPLLQAGVSPGVLESARFIDALALALGKFAAFVILMLVVGRRALPAILHYAAYSGSRELFRLSVLAVALGTAFVAAELFGGSFALGAFLAGTMLSESQLSARAAEESLPFRDAFAVLFFVSIGMLFDPAALVNQPLALALTTLGVVAGNGAIAFALTRMLGFSAATAVTMAASLAQIGEFSFIIADRGVGLGLLTPEQRVLILGASILSILVNPALFTLAMRWHPAAGPRSGARIGRAAPPKHGESALCGHAVLVGCGRVGGIVAREFLARQEPFVVIEDADKTVARLRAQGIAVIAGNAVRPEVLEAANLSHARRLFIAIPNAFEAGQMVERARAMNPEIDIIARAHSEDEVQYLTRRGAGTVIMGEREIALGMIAHAFGHTPAAPRAATEESDGA
jgi:K+:H+ antiporter